MVYKYENINDKIKYAYKSGGFGRLFYRALNVARRKLFKFHTSYWYIRDLSESIENLVPKIKVNITYNAIEDTLNWERSTLHDGNFTLEDNEEIRVAHENNHNYIHVSHEGEIMGFLKVGFDKVYVKEYTKNIFIPDNTAFIYDTFISKKYRGMSIAPYLINEVMKNLSEKGEEFIVCHIMPSNLASQKTYAKIGFKRIKLIWHLRLFGLRVFNCSPEKMLAQRCIN